MLLAYLRDVPLSTFTAQVFALAGCTWALAPLPALSGPMSSLWTAMAYSDWSLAFAIVIIRNAGRVLGG